MWQSIKHTAVLALLCFGLNSPSWATDSYDLVLNGGRVIDPETGLDAVRHIGVRDGKIVSMSETALRGKRVLDVSGLIVSPGFIDLHAHGQTILANRVQAYDGVTTALELESGVFPIDAYYQRRAAEGSPLNYGASVNWLSARIAALLDLTPTGDADWFTQALTRDGWQDSIATPEQLDTIEQLVADGLNQGGLGVGFLTGYAPGSGHKEYYRINQLAAARGVPTFTHARFLSMAEPQSSFEAIQEIISVAASTGVHAHIVHLNSISLKDIELIRPMILNARDNGAKLSTEAYPYGAGATSIGAAMFRGEGWRERIGAITANNFAVDGRRLDEAEFARLQKEAPATDIIIHFLDASKPDERALIDQAILMPEGIIASDGGDWTLANEPVPATAWPLPEQAWSHPRSAGTYARFIRNYVTERQALSLTDAIAKVSYLPAKLLQESVPQMRHKGRLQVGADADIVVFSLPEFADAATFATPAQLSKGLKHSIINGQLLIADGVLNTSIMPGQAVRNSGTR
ncbi:amidohydrolase family protein [Pseudidiomarina sp. 1APP75-27a]|uniref:amidohydrolase family protein n=1 Tax=Pseudidiomarina terrestris TaxID=2820060 RepID=UPI002B05893B|nr:amidohydrolase family protein [Pseudidiomarina sp. 1APP75-27a]MEA3588128.1 amidohydrolase family protein [Pseudidiomarina sp. 1APP75-27a]